jgi:hypothetical protein
MTSRPISLAAALVTLLGSGVAHAREFQPQNNEVTVDVDANFARRGQNNSDVTVKYTWLPQALDRNDIVVPQLRRFVRQPLELGAKMQRAGDATDTVTGLYGFGQAWLADLLYGHAEVGFEYDQVQNEQLTIENAFIAGSGRVEAGVRVLPLLQLGGFYRYRPVLIPLPEQTMSGETAERSGQTQDFGGTLSFATPEDRVLLTATGGYRMVDWTFVGHDFGDVTGRAVFGSLRLSIQLSPRNSFFFRADATATDWVNHREKQSMTTMRPEEMTRHELGADLGYIYWFEGRWGFRFSLGGGYFDKGPLFSQDLESGTIRLGVGFTTRY